MNGFKVVAIGDVIATVDIVITATGELFQMDKVKVCIVQFFPRR